MMTNLKFKELFKDSLSTFKLRFKLLFTLAIIFLYIPNVIFGIYSTIKISAVNSTATIQPVKMLQYGITLIPAAIIIQLLSLFFLICMIFILSNDKKINLNKAIDKSKKFLGKSILLSLWLILLLFPLYLLFIIPGLIYSIYWSFSFYVLIIEKSAIKESLKKSKEMVFKRWWTVLFYGFLVALFTSLFTLIVDLILKLTIKTLSLIGISESIMTTIVHLLIFQMAATFTTIFTIIFMYKFYIALKKTKVKNK